MGIFDLFKKKNGEFDLEKVLQLENSNSIAIELDTRVNELSNYGNDLTKLTEPQKVLLFVENLEREVNNGGFNQFYWNSSGDFAMETYAGLKTIGANKASDILQKANSVWPDQKIPKDRTERQEIQEKIEDEANPVWAQCDSEFFGYPDNIGALLIEYVKRHRSDFK